MSVSFVSRNLLSARCQMCFRCYCSQTPKDTLGPPGKVKQYILKKVTHFVEGYENFLKSKSPKIYRVYDTFKVGVRDLISDTHTYAIVSKDIWQGRELHTFSRRELELYLEMPRLLPKVAPLLVISTVPGGFSIFPVAYYFPRLLLTHHFWTEDQRKEFRLHDHTHRLERLPTIIDHMYRQSKRHIDPGDTREKFKNIIKKLDGSQHPTVEEILDVKSSFEHFPFHVDTISTAYLRNLAKLFSISMRRSRVAQDSIVLLHIDRAMVKEGFGSMTGSELEKACFNRGLNPYGLDDSERIDYLKKWTEISQNLDENSVSLLLHCPVLLAYNHKANRKLQVKHRFRWRRIKHYG